MAGCARQVGASTFSWASTASPRISLTTTILVTDSGPTCPHENNKSKTPSRLSGRQMRLPSR